MLFSEGKGLGGQNDGEGNMEKKVGWCSVGKCNGRAIIPFRQRSSEFICYEGIFFQTFTVSLSTIYNFSFKRVQFFFQNIYSFPFKTTPAVLLPKTQNLKLQKTPYAILSPFHLPMPTLSTKDKKAAFAGFYNIGFSFMPIQSF